VCCCGCLQRFKSSRWFGKGATSSVTADVDIPDKVLRSGFIWQKCERRGRARHFCCGALGIKSRRSKSKSSETKWEGVPPGFWVCCWYLRSSSQGFWKGRREFARTVGEKRSVPFPLSLDWEVLSVMVASVDQYEDLRAGEPKGGLSPIHF
jgi:hypothetical protein